MQSKNFNDMLNMIKVAHVTDEDYNELQFMLGFMDLTLIEESELNALLNQKFAG